MWYYNTCSSLRPLIVAYFIAVIPWSVIIQSCIIAPARPVKPFIRKQHPDAERHIGPFLEVVAAHTWNWWAKGATEHAVREMQWKGQDIGWGAGWGREVEKRRATKHKGLWVGKEQNYGNKWGNKKRKGSTKK